MPLPQTRYLHWHLHSDGTVCPYLGKMTTSCYHTKGMQRTNAKNLSLVVSKDGPAMSHPITIETAKTRVKNAET